VVGRLGIEAHEHRGEERPVEPLGEVHVAQAPGAGDEFSIRSSVMAASKSSSEENPW
jgi:hypothetical protein